MSNDLRNILIEHTKREMLIGGGDQEETDIIVSLLENQDLDIDILKTQVNSLTTAFMEIPENWSDTVLEDYFEYCFVTKNRPREPETFYPLLNLLYGLPLTPITNQPDDWIEIPNRNNQYHHRRSQLVVKRLLPDGWRFFCPCLRAAVPTALFKDWVVSMVEVPFTSNQFPLSVSVTKVYYYLGDKSETDSLVADEYLAKGRLRCLLNGREDITKTLAGIYGQKVGDTISKLIEEFCSETNIEFGSDTYYITDIIETLLLNHTQTGAVEKLINDQCAVDQQVVMRFLELLEEH